MAETDSTYGPKVGKELGGDRFYVKEDGEFKFFDQVFTGTELKSMLRGTSGLNVWSQTSMATTSGAALALVPAYGYHVIKDIAAAESAYMSLSAANIGDEFIILTEGNGSNGLFTLGFSGDISLYDVAQAKMSSLTLAFSADNGSTFIHLKCFETGKWSVTNINVKDTIVAVNADA